jgi:hypothetical protein
MTLRIPPGQSHQQGLFLLLYHVCQSAFADPFHSHNGM